MLDYLDVSLVVGIREEKKGDKTSEDRDPAKVEHYESVENAQALCMLLYDGGDDKRHPRDQRRGSGLHCLQLKFNERSAGADLEDGGDQR